MIIMKQVLFVPVERPSMADNIDPRAFGLAAGIMWAALVAFLELTAHTEYGEEWRTLLEDIYPRYSRDPGDLLWGTSLGFADAFVGGYLFAWLYNRLSR